VLNAVVSVVTFALIVVVPAFVQEFQHRSAITAGLVLLPQGLLTGIGALLGNALPARVGTRRTAVLGMALLSLSTFGLLAVGTGTQPYVTALVLSGRGFAIGLVIQPVLNGLIGSLPPAKVPDGNTLFNIVDRVSGAVGIALIVTFFQMRESALGRAALARFATAGAGTLRAALARAAAGGLHDVVWLVGGLGLAGLAMAVGLREAPAGEAAQADVEA